MMSSPSFHWYGLLVGLGIVAGISAAEWMIKKLPAKVSEQLPDFSHVCIWMVIFGVFGARIYHVWTDWSLYATSPWYTMFAIWNGGLGIWGAVIGGCVGLMLFLFAKKKLRREIIFSYLDLIGFGLPIGQAIGRWGNFVNGELYGKETNFPWGILVNGSTGKYHPLFLYESVLLFLTWCILFFLVQKQYVNIGRGKIFGLYLIAYGLIRFFLEYLRISPAMIGPLATAQWASVLAIGVGMCVWRVACNNTVYDQD